MLARPTLLLVGKGTVVNKSDILAIIDASSQSLPLRRYREVMEKSGRVVDVSKGRAVKAFIVTGTNHLFLCSLSSETLQQRMIEEMEEF